MSTTKLRAAERHLSRVRSLTACALIVLGGGLLTTACGLRREIIEPAPAPLGDAGIPGPDAAAICHWLTDPTVGCTVSNLACEMVDACPASWQQANGPASCRAAGTSVVLETCGGTNRWTFVGQGSNYTICYYDQASGALQGMDAQNDAAVYCNGTSTQVVAGSVPTLCHDDAGVQLEQITCQGPGTGTPSDGGAGPSCSEANPCHGGG